MKIKTLENMSLHRQNKNGDFVYHINFLDADGHVSGVPENVSIEFSTESGHDSFTAERHAGGTCSGCKVSGDGLDVFIPLSRRPIGAGRMLAKTTVRRTSEDFPSGVQNICVKTTTNVLLWDGNSDGAPTIEGNVVLAAK